MFHAEVPLHRIGILTQRIRKVSYLIERRSRRERTAAGEGIFAVYVVVNCVGVG